MKQKKFKIRNATLVVYKSSKSKNNILFTETEPTTQMTATTSICSTVIFNK